MRALKESSKCDRKKRWSGGGRRLIGRGNRRGRERGDEGRKESRVKLSEGGRRYGEKEKE